MLPATLPAGLGDALKRRLLGIDVITRKIGERDASDQSLVTVHHRQPADLVLGHQFGRALDVVVVEAIADGT